MTLVIIPARQKSERLPNKPLQSIGSDPLIVHCWRRAMEADIGPVWVASKSLAIVEAVAPVQSGKKRSGLSTRRKIWLQRTRFIPWMEG